MQKDLYVNDLKRIEHSKQVVILTIWLACIITMKPYQHFQSNFQHSLIKPCEQLIHRMINTQDLHSCMNFLSESKLEV